MRVDERVVENHWSPPGTRGRLLGRILAGLAESGADPDDLTPEQLAQVDEFHIRGRAATLELVDYADVPRGARVLDVGSGLGGPSRLLARERGCAVIGVDLTREYCDVATALAARVGLSDRVSYRVAEATNLPFGDEEFDVAWTQHVSMNVSDKHRMFAEIARVLRPGGRVAVYDPIAGSGRPPHFPVPWAESPALSHLEDRETMLSLLESVGLCTVRWRDVTPPSIAWFRERVESAQSGVRSPVGLHLPMGERWLRMAATLLRNLEEGRIAVVQIALEKPRR